MGRDSGGEWWRGRSCWKADAASPSPGLVDETLVVSTHTVFPGLGRKNMMASHVSFPFSAPSLTEMGVVTGCSIPRRRPATVGHQTLVEFG